MGRKKVILKGLLVDPVSHMPIILLENEETGSMLPIWIGLFEANAIAIELDKVKTPRPMTHDLILSFIASLNSSIDKIVIVDMTDSTFFSEIHIRNGEEVAVVDARPSDAIAIALRAEADIFVDDGVFEKAAASGDGSIKTSERIRKWLENLPSEELGKYEM